MFLTIVNKVKLLTYIFKGILVSSNLLANL